MSLCMVQPAKLSEEAIVDAAIAQLQEGGLATVSLRNVAARLGARAPSLARHVGDKNRLLALMSAQIFSAALDLVDNTLSGAAWLTSFGEALRSKQAQIRDISALIGQVEPQADLDQAIGERLDQMMVAAGLSSNLAQQQMQAIQALVTGWMLFEKSPRGQILAAQAEPDEAFAASLAALINGFGKA